VPLKSVQVSCGEVNELVCPFAQRAQHQEMFSCGKWQLVLTLVMGQEFKIQTGVGSRCYVTAGRCPLKGSTERERFDKQVFSF
jgi:hypothetical protein